MRQRPRVRSAILADVSFGQIQQVLRLDPLNSAKLARTSSEGLLTERGALVPPNGRSRSDELNQPYYLIGTFFLSIPWLPGASIGP